MMKDLLYVGAAAALGEYMTRRFGAQIEAQAAKLKLPPTIAHAAVVGGFAVAGYWAGKSLLG
jgi:hypothetical protein